MKSPITVRILVTVRDLRQLEACTLCFKTLRVGWPTADIHIDVNGGDYFGDILDKLIRLRVGWPTAPVTLNSIASVHLADWIKKQVSIHHLSATGPLVICDPDTVFWKSCEDWEFLPGTLLAGYYMPRIWNDFAKCISVQRIHTSMMVFPDTQKLRQTLQEIYPYAWQKDGAYCPCDSFAPAVRFENGRPTYWDCCANLFNMLVAAPRKSGERLWPALEFFTNVHLSCYDHLNSASFYDTMCCRLEGLHREGFILAHQNWVKNPVPGLWPLVDNYYADKAKQAALYEEAFK